MSQEKEETENCELKEKITEQEKTDELINDLKRLQAEFENYKKRADKESSQLRCYVLADFAKKLLIILDSFELALKNSENHEEFVRGVELIYSQFYAILKEEGLKPIETKQKKFDPYLHEVLLSEKSEKEEDTIIEELQKGYKFKDIVIRHSKVKVAK
jgi:molecular chaperone GrpE